MIAADRSKLLPLALRVVGLIFTFGFYPLTGLWPSGWAWHSSGRSEYLEMIIAVYATLGVFLVLAARDPTHHLSLISFTIWSSVVHGLVMAVQSVMDPVHLHHLYGDVLALFLVAAVLAYLAPRRCAFRLLEVGSNAFHRADLLRRPLMYTPSRPWCQGCEGPSRAAPPREGLNRNAAGRGRVPRRSRG